MVYYISLRKCQDPAPSTLLQEISLSFFISTTLCRKRHRHQGLLNRAYDRFAWHCKIVPSRVESVFLMQMYDWTMMFSTENGLILTNIPIID